MRKTDRIENWPVGDLLAHPDNPRALHRDTEGFRDLVGSVRVSGVLEPLIVRADPGNPTGRSRQVLSGHRRLAAARAAERTEVPVRNLGVIGEEEAFDVVAMANLHEDLTPLEEGKRAALWLDKYAGDAEAVASKLGRTARWVVEHAQIYRHLSADWQLFAESSEQVDRWTASHWAVIARLAPALQAEQLVKFRNAYYSFDRWSVKELARRVKIDLLYLAKASFDTVACAKCLDRSDAVAWLFGPPQEVTGDKTRCLNPKCYAKKQLAAEKQRFALLKTEKGQPRAVAVSLLTQPKKWSEHEAYRKRMSGLKKVHRGLLTAGQVTFVAEGAKGAVPAIVVAGARGRPAIKWVKIKEQKEGGRRSSGPSPAQLAAQRAEQAENQRWTAVAEKVVELILGLPTPSLAVVALLRSLSELYVSDMTGALQEAVPLLTRPTDLEAHVRKRLWSEVKAELKGYCPFEVAQLQPLCDLLGIELDVHTLYDGLAAADEAVEPDLCSACANERKTAKKGRKRAGSKAPKG